MDACGGGGSGPAGCCGWRDRGVAPGPRNLCVPLSKAAVAVRVAATYIAVAAAALALVHFAGTPGSRVALVLLAIALPRMFLGASLLFEQSPPLEVDAWGGMRLRPAAILGEAFGPWGSGVVVRWDEIEAWEVVRATLGGLPVPWGESLLRVVLRQPEAFVAERGCLWGGLRFGWKAARHGTPLVVSDAVLAENAWEIAEFMTKVAPISGQEGPQGGFQVVPLPAAPFQVVVQ